MSSNLSRYRAIAKARRDGFRGPIGDMGKKTRVPNFNLVSQWRALTICNGWVARRRRKAGFLQRGYRDLGKSGLVQFIPD